MTASSPPSLAEQRLRELLELAPDGVFLADVHGRYTDVNEAGCRMLGCSREDIVGKTIADLIHPDDVGRLGEVQKRLLEGQVDVGEWRLRHTDGTYIDVEISMKILAGTRWQGFVRDIRQRKAHDAERERAESTIRANEHLLNSIFEILPIGVWIADRSGRLVRANPAGERIWGGARYVGISEFGQYRGWWADTGEPIAPDEWAMARALTRGETSLGELIRIECFDGSRKTIRNSAMPLKDEAGRFAGAIVVNEDVTDLKKSEDALRRAVRVREDILGIVAHDLRTPLNAIVLQLEVLRMAPLDAELEKALDVIERGAARMGRMIQDLLEIARIESGTLALEHGLVSPASLIEHAVESLRAAAARASVSLEIRPAEALPDIRCDRERLTRVLDNLVGNALKFTPKGGHVTVGAARDTDAVVFSVTDDGAGIPSDHLAHIFDRHWQGRRTDRRGTGLGLAIVKGIVEAHGGRAWVESTLGRGSTFHFSVPVIVNANSGRPSGD